MLTAYIFRFQIQLPISGILVICSIFNCPNFHALMQTRIKEVAWRKNFILRAFFTPIREVKYKPESIHSNRETVLHDGSKLRNRRLIHWYPPICTKKSHILKKHIHIANYVVFESRRWKQKEGPAEQTFNAWEKRKNWKQTPYHITTPLPFPTSLYIVFQNLTKNWCCLWIVK